MIEFVILQSFLTSSISVMRLHFYYTWRLFYYLFHFCGLPFSPLFIFPGKTGVLSLLKKTHQKAAEKIRRLFGAAELLNFGFFADEAKKIIRVNVVKTAKLCKIFNRQFGTAFFDMVISLLRFIDNSADFFLCQIPVFPLKNQFI